MARLSSLAQSAAETDKFRTETCCVIGNYYSIRGQARGASLRTHPTHTRPPTTHYLHPHPPNPRPQHDRAVVAFQRALRLNRAYLSAWTLMGHEYVELKNPAAAIGAR